MIVPWLTFIAAALITYAGFLKLAARILRYGVLWKSTFLFAGIMLVIVILGHVLTFNEPIALRIGHNVVLLVGLVVLGGWFFSKARHEPQRCSSWVVRRLVAHGPGACNDDYCGFRNRYSGSGLSQQSLFDVSIAS